MSEMALPSLPYDEFGGIDWFVLPGQDPELLRGLLAGLTADLQPDNLIARIWTREMAMLTALGEFMRQSFCGGLACLVTEAAVAAGRTTEPMMPGTMAMATKGTLATNSPQRQAFDQVQGRTFLANLPRIDAMNKLAITVSQERDRIIHRFDSRRVGQLQEALDAIEDAALHGSAEGKREVGCG